MKIRTETRDSVVLFYDIHNNYFIDEDGEIVYEISEIANANDRYLFRQNGQDMYMRHRTQKDVDVELVYPTECEACFDFDCPDNPYCGIK